MGYPAAGRVMCPRSVMTLGLVVAQVILKAAPKRMVYVSCNPASQARDLAILCRDYVITAVQPVDMFPHTMHVENVVALQRKAE